MPSFSCATCVFSFSPGRLIGGRRKREGSAKSNSHARRGTWMTVLFRAERKDGRWQTSGSLDKWCGVRPARALKLSSVEFPVHNLGGKIFLPTLNREFIFLSTPPLRICSASICLKALPTIVCFLPKFSSSAQGVYDCNIIPGWGLIPRVSK